MFAHGFNIRFGTIEAPRVSRIDGAPRLPPRVLEVSRGSGPPSFSRPPDPPRAHRTRLAYAKGIGAPGGVSRPPSPRVPRPISSARGVFAAAYPPWEGGFENPGHRRYHPRSRTSSASPTEADRGPHVPGGSPAALLLRLRPASTRLPAAPALPTRPSGDGSDAGRDPHRCTRAWIAERGRSPWFEASGGRSGPSSSNGGAQLRSMIPFLDRWR